MWDSFKYFEDITKFLSCNLNLQWLSSNQIDIKSWIASSHWNITFLNLQFKSNQDWFTQSNKKALCQKWYQHEGHSDLHSYQLIAKGVSGELLIAHCGWLSDCFLLSKSNLTKHGKQFNYLGKCDEFPFIGYVQSDARQPLYIKDHIWYIWSRWKTYQTGSVAVEYTLNWIVYSALGLSGCSHWILRFYIFGAPSITE